MPFQDECDVELLHRPKVKIRMALAARSQPFEESVESLGLAIAAAQAVGFNVHLDKIRKGVPGFHNAGPIFSRFVADQEATHLFFPADDVLYPADVLIRLVNDDKDIVSGIYRKNDLSRIEPANHVDSAEEFVRCYQEGGVYETKFAACHSMMVKRHVIEKMIADYPELAYDNRVHGEVQYALMLPMIRDRAVYQDDFAFSIRARESGFTLWNDFGCRLKHWCGDFLGFEGGVHAG
jgi:hypothetical protein